MRVLGLDYGSKRVGVALGDTEARIASPWKILPNTTRLDLVRSIVELAQHEQIQKIIVGIPRPLSQRELINAQMEQTQAFVRDLEAQGLSVILEDETLTSKLAASHMRERGEKGKRDDLAAAAILQSWLDKK